MDRLLVEKIRKCVRYRDYETAIFLTSSISQNEVLLPVLLYLNGEYSRALFHLHKLNTYTSKYYECLCYKRRKDYKKAIRCLETILERRTEEDSDADGEMREFLIDPEDTEYFTCLMGDLLTLSGSRDDAIEYYTKSVEKNALFSAVENLLLEEKLSTEFSAQMHSVEKEYIKDSTEFGRSASQSTLKKYLERIPGIGSYFVGNAARRYFDLGQNEESKKCFGVLRSKDPMFVHNMDYYSTVLWHSKDSTELGMLCKNMIKYMPDAGNTWKALGNFYSHENDYQRSVLCFKRSLHIREEAYSYTLLGYESIQRNEYDAALKYFNLSLRMFLNNYRAVFGCGLVYMKTERPENAEFFLMRAMKANPRNLQIRVHAMKYYTKRGSVEQSLRILGDALEAQQTNIHEIVEHVLCRKGKFSEVEEFLLLEFVEILVVQKLYSLAADVLGCVEYRGDSYCKKKEMLMEKME